jgi:hypothetical protein
MNDFTRMNEQFFSENQRFSKWFRWPLILLIVWLAYTQWDFLSVEERFKSWKNWEIVWVPILLLVLFNLLQLKTNISKEGVSVQFLPFHWKPKLYSWDSISTIEIRKFSPIKEYGGWGIKYGWNGQGISYTVSGSIGLQLVLKSGKKILIGTHKEVEIKEVLKQLKKD